MKAQELRIGNYVFKSLKSGNGRTISEKIECQDIVRVFENSGSFNYKPIPLTEEWLIKFGFEYYVTEKSRVYRLNNFMATYVFEGRFTGKRFLKYANITFNDFGHIQSVHQLQNLYFDLTGEELKIVN